MYWGDYMDIQILVVEDDEHICGTLKSFLINEGYFVDTARDGDTALEKIFSRTYHLLILDILLPGINGQEILKEYRRISNSPVMMMTAMSDERSQLTAFQNEADDYVVKPFSMNIMLKRVEALLRRCGLLQKEICIGELILNVDEFKAYYGGEEVPLTLKEFEILNLLARSNGRVISHESLLTKIWGYDYGGDERTVHTHIKNLRGKLPENIIKTVRGVGYCLKGEQ